MTNWSCLLSFFIYSSVAVFVVVDGQPTTDDRDDNGGYLANTVARLSAELSRVLDEVAKLKGEL